MTTQKYTSEIEREAERNCLNGIQDGLIMQTKYSAFIKGIHSELNNRIIEIEKREFCLNEFKELQKGVSSFTILEDYILNKIDELNNEINQLKNEK